MPLGFRICYVASPVAPETLAQSLSLEIAGESDEAPDGNSWVARLKASGWSILWSEDQTFAEKARSALSDLSRQTEVIFCEVNETCMWSAAEALREGQTVWRVTHAGDGDDRYDLTVTGTPPANFPSLRAGLEEEQRNGDGMVDVIFEIPLDLAAASHGFRHDRYLEPTDVDTFLLLAAPGCAKPKRGLLSFLTRR